MLTIVWKGVDHGFVENSDLPTVLPFLFLQEETGWRLVFHGGTFLRQKGSFLVDTEAREKAILWLYCQPACQ